VRLLSAADVETRAVYRSMATIPRLPRIAGLRADLSDPVQADAAVVGTSTLFLLTGNEPGFARTQITVVEAARQRGVRHIVKLSALGASDHSHSSIARDHWQVEQAIQQSTIPWTFLRPHAFMQNWLGDLAESVRQESAIYSSIGDGRVPFIDTRDIAAVAAQVLRNPAPHAGKKYFLTGGEAVGYQDVADALSEATGRTIVYRPITMEEARARMVRSGVQPGLIEATLAIAAYQQGGGATAIVSPSVERLLGRSPRSIRDFARDYVAAFR
jgi:uncharacterized protein YbjT (DUF2867 family)